MLLVSDFDYTLHIEKDLHQNIVMIQKWMDFGHTFAIATGRSYPDIKELLDEIGVLYHYLICEDGAKIYDSAGKVLYVKKMDEKDAKNSFLLLTRRGYDAYYDDGSSFLYDYSADCVRVFAHYHNRNRAEEIVKILSKKLLNSWIYLSNTTINILDKQATKKNAVFYLANYLKISKEKIYTIGDDINDLAMLEEYQGVIIESSCILNNKNLRKVVSLYQYIEELIKD